MKLNTKKAIALSQLPAAVLMLVVIGVVAVVGVKMNEQLQGTDTGADKYLAAKNSTLGIQEITSNMQLLGLIIIMGGVITVLLASFGGFLRGGGL